MKETEIKAFLEIVQAGNLSLAAQKNFTSQSNISKQVQNLEDRLGVKLLIRSRGKRTVELTSYGQEFLHLANSLNAIEKEMDTIGQKEEVIELSVCATDLLNNFTFRQFYKKFITEHSNILLHLHTHHSQEIYQAMTSHSYDIAFAANFFPTNDLSVVPLYHEKMYIISQTELSHKKKVHCSELDSKLEIFNNWGQDYMLWHDKYFPEKKYLLQCGTAAMIIDYLDRPGSWAIVPASCVDSFKETNKVFHYELFETPPKRTFYQLTPKVTWENKKHALATFEKELAEYLQKVMHLEIINQSKV